MRKFGKMFAIFLGLATVVPCAHFVACNEISKIGKEEIFYSLSDDKDFYAVKGNGWSKGSVLTIPVEKEGLPVKEILPRGFEGEWMSEVIVGDSVQTIGDCAFYTCWALSKVEIGANVTAIGDWAFASCVELDAFVVSEDNTAFSTINGDLYNFDKTTLVQYAVGKSAETFVVPDSVVTIEDKAFADSKALKNVVINAAVRIIGEGAFSNEHIKGELDIGVERFFYMGNGDTWNDIELGENNGRITQTSLYFYSESWKTGNYWRFVDGVPVAWNEE